MPCCGAHACRQIVCNPLVSARACVCPCPCSSPVQALGCLLYEMCALGPPFDATNHVNLAVKINAGKFARIPPQYSEDLYRAIRWMLHVEVS